MCVFVYVRERDSVCVCASVSGTVVMQVSNNRMVDGPRLMYYTVVMMCTADQKKKR